MERDDSAIAQAREGDRDAFRALVERHSRAIFKLAYRMTGNEQDSEDVVQETFLRAYRRMAQFESRADFGTWLHRIAVNCALDLIRVRRRHEEHRESSEPGQPDATAQAAAADPTPERMVFSGEVQRKVGEVLASLSPKEKAAFVLRHFEGMSIEDISQTMGVRTSAAKNNIFRAVKKLRRELEPLMRAGVRL